MCLVVSTMLCVIGVETEAGILETYNAESGVVTPVLALLVAVSEEHMGEMREKFKSLVLD